MRSLFLRVFLWFWAAMAIVAAVLVATSPYWTKVRPRIAQWEQHAFGSLALHAAEVAGIIAAEGPDGIDQALRRRGRGHVQLFVFDDRGQEYYGQQAPPEVKDIARRAADSRGTEFERVGFEFFAARPATDPRGASYVAVVALRRRGMGPGAPHSREPSLIGTEALLPRLLAVLLVAGVFCYGLARYLSSPMRALRQATRRIAAGDLSARVGPAVGGRGDEFGGLARDFDAMAERVETLVASKRRLLRDVSHELRSPLARLAVALELARQHSGDQAAKDLDRIERESERLNDLIAQLLTLNRLEAGADAIEFQQVDLGDLLASVVADAEFEARARGCSVRLSAAEDGLLAGSPDLLRSAIENVVRNAVRCTEPGSEVAVTLDRRAGEPERLVITVRDRGPGVPEDQLGRLFEPFYRVADARDRETGGTGLGLAITARAVHLHQGSVAARNAPGGGLVVELELPAG